MAERDIQQDILYAKEEDKARLILPSAIPGKIARAYLGHSG